MQTEEVVCILFSTTLITLFSVFGPSLITKEGRSRLWRVIMGDMLPEVRIKFGFFLEPVFEAHHRVEHPEWKSPPSSEVFKKIDEFDAAWKPYEHKILQGLVDTLGLDFYQNVVDVFIVSGMRGGFSTPMFIGSNREPDQFIDTLTHELVHRLISDNTKKIDWKKLHQEQFPDVKETLVLNHIFVHAVHKKIYLEVLNEPYRYERDLARCERFPAYKEAWRIVNEVGYQKIIDEFKGKY